MFYYASKIVSALIWPSSVITMMLVVGTALVLTGRLVAWGRRLLLAGSVLLLVCGFGPVGNWLMLPLEQRFARGELPAEVAGVIILGGFEVGVVSKARGGLALNNAAERLTEAILVALSRPRAKVVFTGDDASPLRQSSGAANSVGQYLEAIGIARQRIVLEGQSRTTWENAIFLKGLLQPQAGQTWVLVTSAFHMPRSVGIFRQVGFEVLPWPADYRTRGPDDVLVGFQTVTDGLEQMDFAFKEWVGLVAYRLTGRSAQLWPGPQAGRDPVRAEPVAAPASPLPGR